MSAKMKVLSEKDAEQLSPILMTVNQLLVEKCMFEKRPQDETNKTILGGVGFFFKERDGKYYLCYDKHPKFWNDLYIKEDIEQIRKYILIEKGAFIEQ